MKRQFAILISVALIAACGWHGEKRRADIHGVREDVFPAEDKSAAVLEADGNGNISQLKKVLDADIGRAGDGLFAIPAVGDDIIFVGDGRGRITALTSGGKYLWNTSVGKSSVGGILIDNGRLLVTTADGILAALDISDGRLLWHARLGAGSFSRPAVLDARVVATTIGNTVETFTISRGEEVWRYANFSTGAVLDRHASPVIDGDAVVALLPGGSITRIDGYSGNVITIDVISNSDSDFHPAASTPIIGDGYTYAVPYVGSLCAVGDKIGARRWCQDVSSTRDMAKLGGNLIVSTTRGEVVSVSMRDGHVAWGAKVGDGLTAPVVFGNDIAVASGRDVFVLDGKTGITVQKYAAKRPVTVLGTGGDGRLLAVLDNASLIGLQ